MITKRIILVRRDEFKDGQGTPGDIYDESGNVICSCIELPNKNNTPRISRIVAGMYKLEHWSSRKYRSALHVLDVPNRSYILMHPGNLAGDTTRGWKTHSLGCILPCTSFGLLDNQMAGLASAPALRKLLRYNPTSVEIMDAVEQMKAA